ncbi:probable inactive purple acid phosphatase 27 isoform X1 [Tripterygium wilfordii]|uniref:probable inactive purple acid phosphatase 27 isoform X1 n=1 Tax=Tripterygium wilfordii TaxID=458696 RepID=UPI0018F81C34|nr:probable inactive purple acid phosphatase 27 isoform X1 [Tripterygium wilfordii]
MFPWRKRSRPIPLAYFWLRWVADKDFQVINRRVLGSCVHRDNKLFIIKITSNPHLPDETTIEVKVTAPRDYISDKDWVAMVSPSNSNNKLCPHWKHMYEQTGDKDDHPLTCHYPVKSQPVKNDRDYLTCGDKECYKYQKNICLYETCSATLKFHVVNIRTSIAFVLFGGGFSKPCFLAKSQTVRFVNPKKPLYGHVSSVGSRGTKMRVTWVSGDFLPQEVQYEGADPKKEILLPTQFTRRDMCGTTQETPAKDFGWHDPGYIHSVVLKGLKPSEDVRFRYGSNHAGWSEYVTMRPPPAAGSDVLRFLAFGDMGKGRHDNSIEHFNQPGSISVVEAMKQEIDHGKVDSIFHVGGLSYATGFLVEWDYFLHQINPLASRVPYMTAIGDSERDFPGSGSLYVTPESGGECGVPYQKYFQMPATTRSKPWYFTKQAGVHLAVISTEHDCKVKSAQYRWLKRNMAKVNRKTTPWLIVIGHRTMYSSTKGGANVNKNFVSAVEPLLRKYKVDLAIWAHVRNYERTCNVYESQCVALPKKVEDEGETYDASNYTAPVHVVVGTGGATLDQFSDDDAPSWSLARISKFGYLKVHVTKQVLQAEFVVPSTSEAEDKFRLVK